MLGKKHLKKDNSEQEQSDKWQIWRNNLKHANFDEEQSATKTTQKSNKSENDIYRKQISERKNANQKKDKLGKGNLKKGNYE